MSSRIPISSPASVPSQSIFDINAFQLQAPGTFGNSGRNNVRGPGINNFDLSLFKDFSLPHIKGWEGPNHHGCNFAQSSSMLSTTRSSARSTRPLFPSQDAAGSPVSSTSPFGSVSGARAPRDSIRSQTAFLKEQRFVDRASFSRLSRA